MDTIHELQGHLEGLRALGCTRGVQCLENELQKANRKLRNMTEANASVLNTFNSLRRAEELRRVEQERATAERKDRWRDARRAIAEEKEATKQLQVKRQKLQELESVYVASMPSRISRWMNWVRVLPTRAESKGGKIVGKSLIVLLGYKQGSPQVNGTIGSGSRKRGTKLWSPSTGRTGLRCSRRGCKRC